MRVCDRCGLETLIGPMRDTNDVCEDCERRRCMATSSSIRRFAKATLGDDPVCNVSHSLVGNTA